MGVFALKKGRVIDKIFYPRDPVEIAKRLAQVENSFSSEEQELIAGLYATGNTVLCVRDPRRFAKLNTRGMDDLSIIGTSEPVDDLDIASQVGISKKKFMQLLSQANLELTKSRVREIDKDQLLIQAVNSIDELEESSNKLAKRLREFFSHHFPEMDYLVKNDETYAQLVKTNLSNLNNLNEDMRQQIKYAREDSLGIKFSKSDLEAVCHLAESILKLYDTKAGMESYIDGLMDEVAPNLKALAGSLLGARLISLAGSLSRLARMPASTIQVLGAEDAFFRFLKTKKKPPKHGIIFTLPEIRGASKNKRGKISRKFAAKLAIAAKADHFKGEFIGEGLREDFLRKIKKI